MEMPDVPACLERSRGKYSPYDARDVTYFLGRESLVSTKKPGMARWREHLFSFMTRNSQKATDFFKLPADRMFEIGIVVEL
jgi:KUP system potassium uptake protein